MKRLCVLIISRPCAAFQENAGSSDYLAMCLKTTEHPPSEYQCGWANENLLSEIIPGWLASGGVRTPRTPSVTKEKLIEAKRTRPKRLCFLPNAFSFSPRSSIGRSADLWIVFRLLLFLDGWYINQLVIFNFFLHFCIHYHHLPRQLVCHPHYEPPPQRYQACHHPSSM